MRFFHIRGLKEMSKNLLIAQAAAPAAIPAAVHRTLPTEGSTRVSVSPSNGSFSGKSGDGSSSGSISDQGNLPRTFRICGTEAATMKSEICCFLNYKLQSRDCNIRPVSQRGTKQEILA